MPAPLGGFVLGSSGISELVRVTKYSNFWLKSAIWAMRLAKNVTEVKIWILSISENSIPALGRVKGAIYHDFGCCHSLAGRPVSCKPLDSFFTPSGWTRHDCTACRVYQKMAKSCRRARYSGLSFPTSQLYNYLLTPNSRPWFHF